MKILHISTTDIEGGAARGAYWLHKGLQKAGVESYMFTASKASDEPGIIAYQPKNRFWKTLHTFRSQLDWRALSTYKDRDPYIFSPSSWTPSDIHEQIREINPDIINLQWICKGFLTPEDFAKFKKPIVWTIRDMWAFTGGCHYTGSCKKYKINCGYCPHLNSPKEDDISRKLWQRKLKAWSDLELNIVAVSHWLAKCARESSLFKNQKIKVIPNALDETIFKPMPKKLVREILGFPQNKKIILFGALSATKDQRKGFQYLEAALQKLSQNGFRENTELVVFGSSRPPNAPEFGMKTTYMGRLHDDVTLASIYAAADVALFPSVEEAFGKTAMESLACGTPVVSFDSTGLKDIVDHQRNGYRAKCYSCDDLANGIAWVLQDEQRWQTLSRQARDKVEQEFTLEIQASAYTKLYKEILQQSSANNPSYEQLTTKSKQTSKIGSYASNLRL